jgi:orotidine-5'-phosphate decarboxylase
MTFKGKLLSAAAANKSWLCIGLDPDPEKMPSTLSRDIGGIEIFLKSIIDSTSDLVCAYKPNSAFFEIYGGPGIELLKRVIEYIPDNIPVILDAKRADIGNTSRMYARAAFDYLGADAITVNPYLGYDSLKPFLDYADKGIIILCVTSNPSSADFQKQTLGKNPADHIMLYEKVASLACQWNANNNVGLVVGATSPAELAAVRKLVGDEIPILIPGVGVQGGELQNALSAGSNGAGKLAIINVSRSVIYASSRDDYGAKARESAQLLIEQIRAVLSSK